MYIYFDFDSTNLKKKIIIITQESCKVNYNKYNIFIQPLWISKDPYITEEKGKLFKWEDGCVNVCASVFWRFEDYKCQERVMVIILQ